MSRLIQTLTVSLALVVAAALGFGAYRWLHQRDASGAAVSPASYPAAPEVLIPDTRPEFSLADRDGRPRSITEWDGKSLVINFWATWCPPCRREIPLLRRLHAARSTQNVEVIGIAVDFRQNVLDYIKEVEIDYPLLIGEQDGLEVAAAFGLGSMGFPFTVFTDNRGRIVTAHLGELHQDQADLILDTVAALNQGVLSMPQAKTRIAEGMKKVPGVAYGHSAGRSSH